MSYRLHSNSIIFNFAFSIQQTKRELETLTLTCIATCEIFFFPRTLENFEFFILFWIFLVHIEAHYMKNNDLQCFLFQTKIVRVFVYVDREHQWRGALRVYL